jgi:ATP-dependent protease ClpP protease subunit
MKKFKTSYWTIAALLVIALIATSGKPINPETIEMFSEVKETVSPFKKAASYGFYNITKEQGKYHVYFSSSIGDQTGYADLVKGLRKLKKEDTVVLHLANFGGLVHSGVLIINAMKDSAATITAKLDAPSYSMGALIACAADKLTAGKYSFLMFHDYSGEFSGKGAESLELIKALDILSTNLMVDECVAKGILTSEQVTEILKGVDVYVHADAINNLN